MDWHAAPWHSLVSPELVPGGTAAGDEHLFQKLGDELRKVVAASPEHLQSLEKWIVFAQEEEDRNMVGNRKVDLHAAADFIEQVLLSDSLRNDSSLRPVLESAARILLSKRLAQSVIASLQAKRILKKSEISRSRFILDAALMIMWRQLHKAAMESAGGCVWYFMTDSSPQFGRDYQVTRVRRILRCDLGRLLAASEELYFLWRQDGRLP